MSPFLSLCTLMCQFGGLGPSHFQPVRIKKKKGPSSVWIIFGSFTHTCIRKYVQLKVPVITVACGCLRLAFAFVRFLFTALNCSLAHSYIHTVCLVVCFQVPCLNLAFKWEKKNKTKKSPENQYIHFWTARMVYFETKVLALGTALVMLAPNQASDGLSSVSANRKTHA